MIFPPKVSVLVPVYNGERYLAECLESVLNQDFSAMEILISDNCSTDGTVEVIKAFARRDCRIRWWINPSNLGCVGNSNACLQQAKGELIKFVYADDQLVSAQALSKMVRVFDEFWNVALVASATQLMDQQSRVNGIWNPQGLTGLTHGRKIILKCMERKSDNDIGCPSVTLFRRRLAIRGFHSEFYYMMDIEMWFHLLEQGDFYWFAEPLGAFRTHSQQGSEDLRQPNFRNYDSLRLLKNLLEKNWFQESITDHVLFAQIYYKRKQFGSEADALVSELMSRLPLSRYYCQWFVHKLYGPIQKLAHHLPFSGRRNSFLFGIFSQK